jgi:RHH-type transcriptional regulator, proline utilization regulon repressor / proline dehydrogenase / delta 1-pyrroline-5-carboxylate dehydrogenase
VLVSSFQSAGQRCSALRVLFVQDDIAEKLMEMLTGAMDELRIGDPSRLSTDIGPVIDQAALAMLQDHEKKISRAGRVLRKLPLDADCADGTFFGPLAVEIEQLGQLTEEIFGPILHVVRYQASRLDDVLDAIRGTGFGLTLGVHSRIDHTVQRIVSSLPVGNCYVNRNMIGAVVGVQPFGGMGLSGTGPKAGGPFYLHRFNREDHHHRYDGGRGKCQPVEPGRESVTGNKLGIFFIPFCTEQEKPINLDRKGIRKRCFSATC